MDASAGAPSYTSTQLRQARSALMGGGSARPLGTRSGWRPGTLDTVVAVTSTTWTLHAAAAVIDAASSTNQGPYEWASDTDITGSVNAADGTNPRIDILYIQIDDSSAGDGSGALTGNVYYLAGTPAGSPSAPTLPSRSFLVATITVPQSGAGSPTVALNHTFHVAAGGILPVYSEADISALSAYDGLTIRRKDLPGEPILHYNGSLAAWENDTIIQLTGGVGLIAGAAKPADYPYRRFDGQVQINSGAGGEIESNTNATDANGYGGIWLGYNGVPTFSGIYGVQLTGYHPTDAFMYVVSVAAISTTRIKFKARREDNSNWANGYGGIPMLVSILGW